MKEFGDAKFGLSVLVRPVEGKMLLAQGDLEKADRQRGMLSLRRTAFESFSEFGDEELARCS